MPEILTESFCERCGTRYTFEAAEPKGNKRLGKLKTFSKGFVNFVSNDETSLDEAFAEARSDEQRELTNQQLDAFHQTFQFCMSCRQYTCANCWNEGESRCLSCAPNLGTEILGASFPGLDPLARIGFGEPTTAPLGGNGHANGNGETPIELIGGPAAAPDMSAWPTADRSTSEVPDLALPAGDGDTAAADAEAVSPVDADVADAVAAAEAARRLAAEAESDRERAAEVERARVAAEAAAQADQAEVERLEAQRQAEAEAERQAAVEAERARDEARLAAEGDRAAADAAERERQVAAQAAEAAETADRAARAQADEQARVQDQADAETVERQHREADAAAERERKVAAEAERQRIAFEDAERARQAAALAAAANVAAAQPDRAAAAADRTSDLMDRFRPGQTEPPSWQITAPEAGGHPASTEPLDLGRSVLGPQPPLPTRPASPGPAPSGANGSGPSWPSPATTPPPQWPMPPAGQSAETGLWAASSREVADANAPTGVQACMSCGLPLSANARFCRRCGTQQH